MKRYIPFSLLQQSVIVDPHLHEQYEEDEKDEKYEKDGNEESYEEDEQYEEDENNKDASQLQL